MLQLQYIKEHTEEIIERLKIKNVQNVEERIAEIISLDAQRRALQQKADAVKAEQNAIAKEIGNLFKQGKRDEAEAMKAKTADLKATEKELGEQQAAVDADLNAKLISLPNAPHITVPRGKSEADNVVVGEFGTKPNLPADALPHWELCAKYNIVDFELGNKITGAGFPVYKGKGARLQRALIDFFLDEAVKAGYVEIMPPLMVNEASGLGTGQLPDKEGQMYAIPLDGFYMIPTAEVPITNIYRGEIVSADQFPIKHAGYSECFRREAGSYGKDVRGLNRLHEFSKVEIVVIEHPDRSYDTLEEMKKHVGGLLDKLGLPYHILKLCGGYQLHLGHDLRLRGVECRTAEMARGLVCLQLRDLPGKPHETALQGHRRQDEAGAHPQRKRPRPAAHRGRPAGKQPDTRRHRHARVSAALSKI